MTPARTQIRGTTQIKPGTVPTSALVDGSLFIKKDGTVAMAANLSLGGFKIVNLADPTNPTEAATKNYVDTHGGGGGGGTVTSVGASGPVDFFSWSSAVTTSGVLTATLQNQHANMFFAGPVHGPDDVPSFRSIIPRDLNLIAKGDLLTCVFIGSGTGTGTGDDILALERLGVGTDGWVLTADSSQPTGLKWAPGGGGPSLPVSLANGGSGTDLSSAGIPLPIVTLDPGASALQVSSLPARLAVNFLFGFRP